jgi:hypothetical protein
MNVYRSTTTMQMDAKYDVVIDVIRAAANAVQGATAAV